MEYLALNTSIFFFSCAKKVERKTGPELVFTMALAAGQISTALIYQVDRHTRNGSITLSELNTYGTESG